MESGSKQESFDLRKERVGNLIEAAMSSESRTVPVLGGPLLVFPKLSSQTRQTLGPPLSGSFERQLAFLLTPGAEPFARSLGQQDTSHFHIAVPSESEPLLEAAERNLKAAMAAIKIDEQLATAYRLNMRDSAGDFLEPGHPENVVALIEAHVAAGQPLERALSTYFHDISAIPGVSIVFHTLEGDDKLLRDPRRFHLFPLDSSDETQGKWPVDNSGSVTDTTPVGFAMGFEFYFWPAGTVEATAPSKNQEIVVSPVFTGDTGMPSWSNKGMPF
jgi:hypothetical protein